MANSWRQVSPGPVVWPRALPYTVASLGGFALAISLLTQVRSANFDHHVYLARALAQGVLWVDGIPSYPDVVYWNGHAFLPFGPLPGVALVPFLPLLDAGVRLVWISHLLTVANLALMHVVLTRCGIRDERRSWALLLFFASSPYLAVWLVGNSYFFAHVLATTCILLAMVEALGRNRGVVVGLALGMGFAARQSVLFGAPFALWLAWQASGRSFTVLARYAVALAAGAALPIAAVLLYNWARFGNPLETGYSLAQLKVEPLELARSHGLFSLAHVPKNLFMMLLQGPQPFPSAEAAILQPPYVVPSAWGMSLFYTTPALVYAFLADRRRALVQASWLAALATLVPLVTYYGVGWVQFGYRYALDFLPYLVPVVALGMRGPVLSRKAKALVLLGVAVCVWGTVFMFLG